MLTVEELKRRACETIEKRKKEIIGVSQQVLSHPEAGFREYRTAGLVAQKFGELQIPSRERIGPHRAQGARSRRGGGRSPSGHNRRAGLAGGHRASPR